VGPPITGSLLQLIVAGGWLVVQLARGRGSPGRCAAAGWSQ
jgi:hypothetical protein